MPAHTERTATLLARVDDLDDQQARAALRSALLAFGELHTDTDPETVLDQALLGIQRSMEAPASATPWRARPNPRPSSLRAS